MYRGVVQQRADPLERDESMGNAEWLLVHVAGRIIEEWSLVRGGMTYAQLGYAIPGGATPRRKIREYLVCERAFAECAATARRLAEQDRARAQR